MAVHEIFFTITALFLLIVATNSDSPEEDESTVPVSVPVVEVTHFISNENVEYQQAVELADKHLREVYKSHPQVYRPRNYMVTFVASRPDLLDVTVSYWLETIETGLVQKCEGHVTIERGKYLSIDTNLWDIKCE